MLAANPDGAAEDILEAMKESHGADLEDEEGRTLEERVIETSLKILKKQKAHELTERVFLAFAAFPEDVAVPAAFFNKLAPVLAGCPVPYFLEAHALVKFDLVRTVVVSGSAGSCLGSTSPVLAPTDSGS